MPADPDEVPASEVPRNAGQPITVNVPGDVMPWLRTLAEEHGTDLSQEIVTILRWCRDLDFQRRR